MDIDTPHRMHFPLTMPGSKRRVFPQILPHIPPPEDSGGVLIPFFGTGADAQYLHAAGHRIAHCGDGNPHLCKLYQQLRNATSATLTAMTRAVDAFPRDLDGQRAWYIETRAQYNDAHVAGVDTPETAAIFLAVWRAAFNGLARANARGVINSPPGMAASNGAKKTLIDLKALAGFAEWLATIPPVQCGDYAEVLRQASSGDTVYLDPPYVGTFDGYFGEGFDTDRLVREVCALPEGVAWALSNATHERWSADFPDAAQVEIQRAGTVSCKASTRGTVSEVLVVQTRCGGTAAHGLLDASMSTPTPLIYAQAMPVEYGPLDHLLECALTQNEHGDDTWACAPDCPAAVVLQCDALRGQLSIERALRIEVEDQANDIRAALDTIHEELDNRGVLRTLPARVRALLENA